MGTLKNGLFGGFSGKVGNVVGAKWRDIEYIRSLPTKLNDPKSRRQVKQRSKFSVTLNFQKTITSFLHIGFKEFANGRMTAFNAASSYNMKNGTKSGPEGIELDFSNVLVSRGSLCPAIGVNVKVVDDEFQFRWGTTFKENASPNDIAMVLAYNSTKVESVYDINAGKRNSLATNIKLPQSWKGDIIVTYITFKSEDGSQVSDSVYAGKSEFLY